mgnify:CR=1 FL=1
MKYVIVNNFKCNNCGSKEYAVIDLDNIEIICNECGEEYNGEYKVIEEND